MKKLALPKTIGNGKDTYSPQHIICCEADGQYTDLHLIAPGEPGWKKLAAVTFNLGCFENWLRDYNFQRLSKSIVVNLEYVSGWEVEDKSTFINLQYNCCGRIKLGSNWRDEFFSHLLINHSTGINLPRFILLRNFCLLKTPFR